MQMALLRPNFPESHTRVGPCPWAAVEEGSGCAYSLREVYKLGAGAGLELELENKFPLGSNLTLKGVVFFQHLRTSRKGGGWVLLVRVPLVCVPMSQLVLLCASSHERQVGN